MQYRCYRLKDPTLAISDTQGKQTMLTVPAGSVVTVDHPATESSDMFDVVWNGRHVLMFGRDLSVRGEMVSSVTR